MTATKAKAEQPAPPPAAVAADAHWAAKMERLRNRSLPERTLKICDNDDAKDALDRAHRAEYLLKAQVEDVKPGESVPDDLQAGLARATEVLAAAQAAVDAETIELRFRGLPRPQYEALLKAHPPTEKQAEDGEPWNTETFAPELVAASSADGMSLEDAEYFLTTWTAAEANALFNAAYGVQQLDRSDLGKG